LSTCAEASLQLSCAELEAIESDCNCAGCCADELVVTAPVPNAANGGCAQGENHQQTELLLIGVLLLSVLYPVTYCCGCGSTMAAAAENPKPSSTMASAMEKLGIQSYNAAYRHIFWKAVAWHLAPSPALLSAMINHWNDIDTLSKIFASSVALRQTMLIDLVLWSWIFKPAVFLYDPCVAFKSGDISMAVTYICAPYIVMKPYFVHGGKADSEDYPDCLRSTIEYCLLLPVKIIGMSHESHVYYLLMMWDVAAMVAFGWGIAQDEFPLPLLVGYFVTGWGGAIRFFLWFIVLPSSFALSHLFGCATKSR
jgi:hypothetical protein